MSRCFYNISKGLSILLAIINNPLVLAPVLGLMATPAEAPVSHHQQGRMPRKRGSPWMLGGEDQSSPHFLSHPHEDEASVGPWPNLGRSRFQSSGRVGVSAPIAIFFHSRFEVSKRLTPNMCLFFMAFPVLTVGPQHF